MFLPNLTEITVGTSEHVWGFDANSGTLYRWNPRTNAFELVDANIKVASIDVSYEGHLVALDNKGVLYLWDPASGSFVQKENTLTFDQVAIGNDTLWALDGSTLYFWDDNEAQFQIAFDDAKAFAVSKEDDAAYLIDGDGNLRQFSPSTDGEFTFDVLTDDLGIDEVVQLASPRGDDLWALDEDGQVYQLSTADLTSAETPLATFVLQSPELGLDGTELSDIAVDDKGILYGVNDSALSFYDTEPVAVQNDLGQQTTAVALTTDATGITHYAYSTEGGVYHSVLIDGVWSQAQLIAGSAQASEIEIGTDAAGNVYLAWVDSIGNGSEVYVTKGAKNQGFGGYEFSPAVQVTDDAVADEDVDMEVTSDGLVTLTSNKIDVFSSYDDYDTYQYSLDGDSAVFTQTPSSDTSGFEDILFDVDPLGGFLNGTGSEVGGADGFVSLGWPAALGVSYSLPGLGFSFTWFQRTNHLYKQGSGHDYTADWTLAVGFNLSDLAAFKPVKLVFPEIKLSSLTVGKYSKQVGDEPADLNLILTGLRFNGAVDFLGPAIDVASAGTSAALKAAGVIGAQGGLFTQEDFLVVVKDTRDVDPQADADIYAVPITFVDADGNPITADTPESEVRAVTTLDEIVAFAEEINGFDQSAVAAPEGGGVQSFDNRKVFWNGAYLALELIEGIGIKATLRAGLQVQEDDGVPNEVSFRSYGEFKLAFLLYRLWDIRLGYKFGEDGTGVGTVNGLPLFADYNVGGTTNVHDDGLIFVGDTDAESDIWDNEAFDYVLLPDGRAFGVYVQETVDETDETINTVNSIDGILDPTTGNIVWDLDTITKLPGSLGFNVSPKIAVQDGDDLIVTWGNTASDNDDLEEVLETPPGKPYVLFGGNAEDQTLDLANLQGGAPPSGADGFYYTSDEFFYGIGSSVSQLGDINSGSTVGSGNKDFIIGAPNAEAESGKAYVVFSEAYDQFSNLDSGTNGEFGFNLTGQVDSELGFAVSTAGDFNNDGTPDIAVAAPGANNHAGSVYILYGGNDWSQSGSETGTAGAFAVADIGTVLDGIILNGSTDGGRFGSALAGGYDITGDNVDDLAIGSFQTGTITIASHGKDPFAIGLDTEFDDTVDNNDYGLGDIGAAVSMLPDINGDGHADLAIGDQLGSAYVVLGGERLETYATNYVASWTFEDFVGQEPIDAYRVVFSFDGVDANGDGILSTEDGEISSLTMEVFERRQPVATYEFTDDSDFEFSYDTSTGLVLANAGAGQTDTANGLYGLSVGFEDLSPDEDAWILLSSATDDRLELRKSPENGTDSEIVASSDGLGNNLFDTLSTPGIFDLRHLEDLPQTGFRLNADASLPLQVANAGDIDGDGRDDLIVGYDQSEDETGQFLSGQSYVLYASDYLTDFSGDVDLALLGPEFALNIPLAGGQVSAAGNVNNDFNNGNAIDDLLVSAPNVDNGTAQLAGQTYVIYGNPDRDGTFTIGYTLEDTIEFERSGAALAPLGDLNGDGFGDYFVGAPQTVDPATLTDAANAAALVYATRDLGAGDDWSFEGAVDDGLGGQIPAALAATDQGTLIAWAVTETDSEDTLVSTKLYVSFFDGSDWSDAAMIRDTSDGSGGEVVTIPEVTISGGSTPIVLWIEADGQESGTTEVFQSQFVDGAWQSPTLVEPVLAEAPPPRANSFDGVGSTLVVGDERVTVEDATVIEPDTGEVVATFVVTRAGDLSAASTYQYRVADFSAQHGLDYLVDEPVGEITFGVGETVAEIEVRVLADSLNEAEIETLRLEVSSNEDGAFVSSNGLAVPGANAATAVLRIADADNTIDLAAIGSGFKLAGQSDAALGYDLNSAGDLNGDGIGDFMIAAPTFGSNDQGRAYVIYGSEDVATDLQDRDLDDLSGTQVVHLDGTVDDSQAGTALGFGQSGAQPFIAIGASGTLDNSQYGRVYITTGASLSGQTSLELNSTNVLEIIIGDGSTGDLFGRALTVANLNEAVGSGNLDDLIVASDDAIYVIYDVLSQGTTGTVELSDFTKVTKITNGDGTGFGNGLVVTNFDGDNFNDLITGSPLGNELIDSYGLPNGSGGIVSVLWGTDDGLADAIDIADIDQHGFNLLGQAAFTPSDTSVELDPSSGGIDDDGETPLAGTDLVDFVGNAITAVDLDGDGQDELVIGAPLATLADPDGSYTLDGISKGRVYVLYGGDKANTDWRNLSGDYELYSLYDANAGDGLILEGTETGGLAGWSVANAGQFRGNGDVVDSVAFKDLLIGAPGANANAGQAYVVFGSEINFTELDGNVFEIEAIVDPGEEGVLPIFTFQGIDDTLTLDNTSNDGAVGFAVAGLGDITAKEFGTAGGTDIGIGAPFVDVDGKGQTYIATGAPYIQPGNGIAVEDLRSDNGFVVQTAGSPAAIGDFNGDGFADFALEQNSVVFGAPIVTSEDFQRELALGALPVGYPLVQDRLEWTGYGFEPEDLTPEQRDALTLLLQTLVDSGLEGLSEQEVFDALSNGAEIEDLLEALSIDFVDEDGNIDLVGLIGDLQFMLGYSISIDFSGKDVDGDGFIRQWSDSTDPARNELTSWLLTVYDPDGAVYARATLAQQKAIGLNFNYDIAKEQVVTGVRDFTVLDPATTFNLAGVSARDQTIYAFFTAPVFESPGAPRYPLQVFAETNQEVTELEGTFSGGLRTAESGQSTAILRSQNAQRGDGAIYGGDFNGDGIDDFVEIEVLQLPRMGSNLEFLRVGYAPVTFGYNAFSYTGSASPEGTVEDPIAGKIPLALITGTATGDVDGDGYTDLLVTGYSSFMVNPIAAASDNTFAVIAFKGGQGAFDFSNPEVLHEVPIDAGTVPGALTTLDVNQDGKDELIALSTVIYPYANNGTLSGLNLLVIEDGSYDDPTVIELTEDITGIAANLIQDVNAVNHGDLNGDGITDLVFGIQYATTPGGREVSSAEFIVYGTGELDFTVGSGSSPQITAIRYESSKFNSSPYADLQETQYAPRSTAIGDFNGDGIDDLLVTNNRPDANSYVIYGAPDLPSGAAASALANSPGLLLTDTGAIRNAVTGQAYDGGYRAIKGLEFLSQAYAPLAAGDVNGDGLMDIALVDGTNGLTTVVFGERPESEQTLGVTYLEGSEDADILIQKTTKPTNTVHVVASSEDDFIQTIADEQVLIFAGQGDDQIGLSSTDSGDIIAIDGGLGHDTLFFNPEIGTSNNLDLTKANIKGIEVIDLNTGNRLTLNAYAVKNLSETSNTLIVKGENSIVVTKGLTADTEWQQVGEGTYDGEIYDIHQFTYLDGPDTNIRVWTQRDGIALSATLIGIGTPIPNQSIKETQLFGYTVPDETFVSEDGDDFELSATLQDGSPLPDWLDFDPETGRFSGTPGSDDKGDYDITVTATTEAEDTIDDTFQLQVFDENTIIGTPDRDRLWGDREDNLIFGKEGDDFIWGRRGDDLLNGDEGNDYLNGGFGDDTLRGGLGADTHKGGWGADTYIGTAEEFGGSDDGSRLDKIIGLGKRDEIIFDSFDFDLEVVNTGWGRAEVRFDSDGDGSLESTLLIQGFLGRNADFNVERADGDTIVTLDDSPFGGFFTDLFDGLSERWDFF